MVCVERGTRYGLTIVMKLLYNKGGRRDENGRLVSGIDESLSDQSSRNGMKKKRKEEETVNLYISHFATFLHFLPVREMIKYCKTRNLFIQMFHT